MGVMLTMAMLSSLSPGQRSPIRRPKTVGGVIGVIDVALSGAAGLSVIQSACMAVVPGA